MIAHGRVPWSVRRPRLANRAAHGQEQWNMRTRAVGRHPGAERRRDAAGDAGRAGRVRTRSWWSTAAAPTAHGGRGGSLGARVLHGAARAGRRSLRPASRRRRSDWLLLLHADTRLGPGWPAAATAICATTRDRAAYFRFALDSDDPRARRLERLVAWRCRALALPYGDQGLLIHRDLLRAVGGIRPLPLMEDVDLVRRLGRHRLVGLDVAAITSAAKWQRDGWYRRSPRNLLCLALYFAGVPPRLIARLYRCKRHVFVFARAPRLGAVKRRLARDIGDRAALRFPSRATLTRLLRGLAARPAVPHRAGGHPRPRPVPPAGPRAAHRPGQRRSRRAHAPRRRALPARPRRHHRLRHPRRARRRRARRLPRAGPRRRGVRPGRGRRLLAGRPVAAPPGATVRRGALVHRARAGRHAGEFPRPARRLLRTLRDVDTAADWHRSRSAERLWR